MTLPKYECQPGCRCPLCDETCAAVMKMDPNTYAEYLQRTTAAMLATRPTGANYSTAMQHMSDYTTGEESTAYRTTVQAPEAPAPQPPAATPLAEVRAMVKAKKVEMAAERKGGAVRNRILSKFASDAAYASKVKPGPYDVALGREIDADLDLYDVLLPSTGESTAELPAPPRPYDEPIRQLRERDRLREANR